MPRNSIPLSTTPSRGIRSGEERPSGALFALRCSGRSTRRRRGVRDACRAVPAFCSMRSIAGRLALPAAERDSRSAFSRRARRDSLDPARRWKIDELRALIAEIVRGLGGGRALRAGREGVGRRGRDRTGGARSSPNRSAIPPWQRHFSASALNAYTECARKWFYRYACAAVEDRGSAASAYGTAFHLALEDFHGDFPRPVSRDRAAMRRRMRECVTWAFERNRDGFETTCRVRAPSTARAAHRAAIRRMAPGAREGSALRSARTRSRRQPRPRGSSVRRIHRSAGSRRTFRRHSGRRL